MSDQIITTLIIAFFASLAPTIAAIAALMVSRDTDHKVDASAKTIEQIHVLTNSNLTQVSNDLKIANSKIDALERLVTALGTAKGIADVVAERLAQKVPP